MHSVKNPGLVRSFVLRCERNEPSAIIVAAFRDAMRRLGVRYYACYTHGTDPRSPPREAITVHNYPGPWVRFYSEERLHEIDPVIEHAARYPLPFFWDARAFRAQLKAPQSKVLAAARTFGLVHGYTMPIHLSWAPGALCASCSVVPDIDGTDAIDYLGLQLMVEYLYVALCGWHPPWNSTAPVVLSRRERQSLTLVGQGKDDEAVGRVLHVTSATVHTYIERAKQRLQVTTRMEAVIHALMGRQILFADLARPQDTEHQIGLDAGSARKAARARLRRLDALARSRR